jgi:hypothetical protein
LGTLLTQDEESRDAMLEDLRFDTGLLAGRLMGATDWLVGHREAAGVTHRLLLGISGTAIDSANYQHGGDFNRIDYIQMSSSIKFHYSPRPLAPSHPGQSRPSWLLGLGPDHARSLYDYWTT